MSIKIKHRVCHQMKNRRFCDKAECDYAHYFEEYSPPNLSLGGIHVDSSG